jgi:lipopolysaccharide transport system ATP-binding protein
MSTDCVRVPRTHRPRAAEKPMSVVISVENVSKRYRLGETNRDQLVTDFRRWWTKLKLSRAFQRNARAEAEPVEEGDFWALKDVSFEVKAGSAMALVGINGAGKSTLLKIISRITAPTKGKVRFKGRIGSLLEIGTGFHPELTGRDNVFLNGAILGMSRAEVKSRFDQIVEFAEIDQFIDTPVKRYSSGMYVRLAFAVSAFLEPEILILDEVLAVGDIKFRTKCLKRLEQLINGRHTIMFVAHDAGIITKYCDTALWLERGSIKAFGSAEAVADGYQSANRPTEKVIEQNVHGGTGEFLVTAIELLDEDGQSKQSLACGERCFVALNCERRVASRKEARQAVARVVFYDEFGGRMFSLSSQYGERQLASLGDRTRILCEIPKLPLLPGIYRLNYDLSLDGECVDAQVSARNVEVVPGKFYGISQLPTRSSTPICVGCTWRVDSTRKT